MSVVMKRESTIVKYCSRSKCVYPFRFPLGDMSLIDADKGLLFSPSVISLSEASPLTGENVHMATRIRPTRLIIRNLICEVTVLMSEVLPASMSRTPMRSRISRHHSKTACVARSSTDAKRIGKTVGSRRHQLFVIERYHALRRLTSSLAFHSVSAVRGYHVTGA